MLLLEPWPLWILHCWCDTSGTVISSLLKEKSLPFHTAIVQSPSFPVLIVPPGSYKEMLGTIASPLRMRSQRVTVFPNLLNATLVRETSVFSRGLCHQTASQRDSACLVASTLSNYNTPSLGANYEHFSWPIFVGRDSRVSGEFIYIRFLFLS